MERAVNFSVASNRTDTNGARRLNHVLLASEFHQVSSLLPDMLRKPAEISRVVVVPTAAKVALNPPAGLGETVSLERWESIDWIKNSIAALRNIGFRDIKVVDIDGKDSQELSTELDNPDLLFVAGGNPFALTRGSFRDYVRRYIEEGDGLYVGSSAGSVIVGDMTGIRILSRPEELLQLPSFTQAELDDQEWQTGIGLIDATIVPHAEGENEEYEGRRQIAKEECHTLGVPTIDLSDRQALVGRAVRRGSGIQLDYSKITQ